MHQSLRVVLMLCLAAPAACGTQPAEEEVAPPQELASSPPMAPDDDAPTRGSIGPVEYDFVPGQLARAEIQLELPPAYETQVWATKLIPAERAAELGETGCRYGEAPRAQVCTAEKESGLAMALLERPIGDYRAAFLEASIPEDDLAPAALAGSSGFAFTAAAEGAGTTYAFYPVGDRTLLLANRFADSGDAPDPAIRAVLETIDLPERDGGVTQRAAR